MVFHKKGNRMTYNDFNNLKVGDRVLIVNCGMDSGIECKVVATKYNTVSGTKIALEPINPYTRFVCGNGRGTRRKVVRSYGVIQRVDTMDDW